MTAGDIRIRTGEHGDSFSGIVLNGADDALQMDALAVQQAGAADVVGTISGWINVPNITGGFCMFGFGDAGSDEHLWVGIAAGKLFAENVDGGTKQWEIVSTTATITPHKWHHIALVHDGARPFLFLDGEKVAMTDTDDTDLTEWTNGLAGLDAGNLGLLEANSGTTQDFLGGISYVKYATGTAGSLANWTDAQVKQEYDFRTGHGTGTGVTTGVLALWTLDNSLLETVTGGGTYDVTVVSDAQFDIEYSQMTSKMRLLAPVVADDISIFPNGQGLGFTAVLVTNA